MSDFTPLSPELFHFLAELEAHNERTWFKANQARYEAHVREPARAFVRAMGPRLARISEHLVADDRKVGGSLMRVQRDLRFSKDKRPYKTNVGIQFRHDAGKNVHAPGVYVHLSLDEVFMAAGMWMPDSAALGVIRARIDAEQDEWRAVVEAPALSGTFERQGDALKRPPRGYPADHPFIDDLKRKSHIAVHSLTEDDALAPDFPDRITALAETAAPLMRFLCAATDEPF